MPKPFDPDGRFSPDQVFRLAQGNVHIAHLLMMWRAGDLTWEQMLTAALLTVAEVNESLRQEMRRCLENLPPVAEKK